MRCAAWVLSLAAVQAVGCAGRAPAPPPRVRFQARSVRDEDTGQETSEWRVEARAPGATRVWLAGAAGGPVELAAEGGLLRAARRSLGPAIWLEGGDVLLVVSGAAGDGAHEEEGAAIDHAVLARDEGDDGDAPELVSTPLELPPPPPRPVLEGLRAGPEGQRVCWRVAGPAAWLDLIVSDAETGGTVFRALGAGRSADGTPAQEEPLPAGLLRPDRAYVVELRAREELGLVALEQATRRTLRLP